MTERFTETVATGIVTDNKTGKEYNYEMRIDNDFLHLINNLAEENEQFQKDARELEKENELLKKGMIEVVDRYIKNVECNPPSSARTYMKIKGALVNIREDLRDLRDDFE